MRTTTHRIATSLVVLVLGAGVTLADPGASGAADDPPGTVALAQGPSVYPEAVHLLGVVGQRLIYDDGHAVYTRPTTPGGVSTEIYAIPGAYYGDDIRTAGDSSQVWVLVNLGGVRRVIDLDHPGTSRSIPQGWVAPSPDGGYTVVIEPDQTSKIYDNTYPVNGQSSATLVATAPDAYPQLLPGPDGLLIQAHERTGQSAQYVPYDDPGHPVAVPEPAPGQYYLTCSSLSRTAAGCGGADQPVVRLSLTGGAPVVVPSTGQAQLVSVTDTATGWMSGTTFETTPAAGGAITASDIALTGYQSLVADHDLFYGVRAGGVGTYGILSTPDAGTAPTTLRTSPAAPVETVGISLSAGRVTWADDQAADEPLWQRSVDTDTNGGGGVALGAQLHIADIGADGAFGQQSASGIRTVWTVPGTARVTDGQHVTDIAGSPSTLSGTRVLYVDNRRRRYVLHDLVHGTDVKVDQVYGAVGAALWGVYLAYYKADGSIWRKRLASPSPAVELTGPLPAGDDFESARVVTYGDYVAWTRYFHRNSHTSGGLEYSAYRNARTMAPIVAVGSDDPIMRAADDGFVTVTLGAGTRLHPWSGAASSGAASLALPNKSAVTYGSITAFIGLDRSPRIAPLGVRFSTRPRSLGNPIAATHLRLGHSWAFDLPLTQVPTSCQVQIRSMSRHLVRTLPCDPTSQGVGEVVSSWDGRTSTGRYVNPTTVRWGVVAGTSDGPLVNVDGTIAVTHGFIAVR